MEEELLKMSVNARCVGCKEPTKFVAGFYDGPRGEHGCFYDCENEACAVNQILRCAESKEAQKMNFRIRHRWMGTWINGNWRLSSSVLAVAGNGRWSNYCFVC